MTKQEQIEEMAKIIDSRTSVGVWMPLKTDKQLAEELFAAGYRKQVEAEWILEGLLNPKCSACKMHATDGTSRYCPHCGSKMK